MGKRKKKWPKGMKPKLYQGGVLNERPRLDSNDVIPKIERTGREFTTRLVDTNDPYNLRGRY
ncbi:hypothetical protein DSCW_19710 [Desulfosarcina widdelii]|uniref:Uncharacterized protein n=1 Tax=Desulfosarcina widdelii TaxID=947919 RepID=A0A5K7Z7V2_9BACT|nr:hypothetical protein [Desulfosarcina widdelii]BBO74554.1 hypothetical protein DSCW_19710 [Desulfosarcina widdelii]